MSVVLFLIVCGRSGVLRRKTQKTHKTCNREYGKSRSSRMTRMECGSGSMMSSNDKENCPPRRETILLLGVEPKSVAHACQCLCLCSESSSESAFGCIEDRYRIPGTDTEVIAAGCGIDTRIGNRMLNSWLQEADTLVYLGNDSEISPTRSSELFFSLLPSLPARIHRVVVISDREEISDHLHAYVGEREYLVLDTVEELSEIFGNFRSCRKSDERKRRSDTIETAPSLSSPFSAK